MYLGRPLMITVVVKDCENTFLSFVCINALFIYFISLLSCHYNNEILFRLCEMGCYGIGVSRLLQAIVEDSLMTHDRMIWPLRIAPFFVCVTPLYHKKVFI